MSHIDAREYLMDRRCLIKLGAACSLFGVGQLAHAEDRDKKRRIRIAVKYSMIAGRVSVVEKFKILKAAGFAGTEISVRERAQVKEILRAVNATGVVVHGVTHGNSDEYREPINLCKAVGGDAVLIIAKQKPDISYAENFKLAQGFIRKALPQAEKLGIRLLVENVRATFLKKAEEMARFIDELKSPLVGAYFDTGNAITWTDQSAEHWARVLGPRIVKMDIKDRGHADFGDRKTKSKDAVGTDGGEVHWKNVRKELAKIEFGGWATAEVKGGDKQRLTKMAGWMEHVLRI